MSSFSPNPAANNELGLNVDGLTLEQSLDILDSLPAEGAAAATVPIPPTAAQPRTMSNEGKQIENQVYKQTNKQTNIQTNKQANKQT